MEMFLATFQAIVTLLGVGVLGFLLIARKVIPENVTAVLNRLALDIAMPFTVFYNILVKFDPDTKADWWTLPLWWLFFLAVDFGFAWTATRISRTRFRHEFMMTLFFQNAIFIPMALLSGIFGFNTPYLVDLFIFTMFYATFLFSSYHWFFPASQRPSMNGRILNYVLIATIIAMTLKLTRLDWIVPKFILSISQMIGNMSLPLLMMVLGGNLYRDIRQKGAFYWAEIVRFIGFKIILFPIVMMALVYWIRPPSTVALLLIIESAVPPVISVPALIENCGGNRNLGNQLVIVSFISCILTIPFFIWTAARLGLF
ncbi:MAG: AEC family transporter [Candidatus Delongbacteria bacterium]|nr:AEC family transporter [Candidatus Delongbacteria bacterium]